MEQSSSNSSSNPEQLQAEVASLRLQVDALLATIAQLQQQLAAARKNSSTSSKPPSSDIVKPPPPAPPAGETKRSAGGQIGHPKTERALFPEQSVTPFIHTLAACPGCGGSVCLNAHIVRIVQQVEFCPPQLTIEQHTSPEYWCTTCQKTCSAAMPAHIRKGGLVGPRLTALIAYLKGICHASYSTIRKFLRDVVQVTISRAQLAKVIARVSQTLKEPYQDLLDMLKEEPSLNVDETGHRDNGKRMWTWCFRAEMYTLFKIDAHRSADVLIEVLGREFDGVLGSDFFSAYRCYMRECDVVVQFCLAHLIRDVKFLTTLPDKAQNAYGERLRESLRELFGLIHRREQMSAEQFQSQLQQSRDKVLRAGTTDVPKGGAAETMSKRLQKYGGDYFTFVTTPGVDPTNNRAEQAIRFVVIDRLITQGTRSESGQRFCERMWTVIATCTQQGRNVWEYLQSAVGSWFESRPAPSLAG